MNYTLYANSCNKINKEGLILFFMFIAKREMSDITGNEWDNGLSGNNAGVL
jgi:hypothetical protein